jgi:hypothetical protein
MPVPERTMPTPVAPTPRRAGGKPKRTLVIGLVLVCGALYGFFRVYGQWATSDASGSWPKTAATISASSIVHRETLGGGGRDAWTVHVTYDYSVDGKKREGTAIHLGSFPSYSSEAEARAVQAAYPEGATTSVSYDPADPASAVLEPGFTAAASSLELSVVLLGMVFALGLAAVVQSLRRLKAP